MFFETSVAVRYIFCNVATSRHLSLALLLHATQNVRAVKQLRALTDYLPWDVLQDSVLRVKTTHTLLYLNMADVSSEDEIASFNDSDQFDEDSLSICSWFSEHDSISAITWNGWKKSSNVQTGSHSCNYNNTVPIVLCAVMIGLLCYSMSASCLKDHFFWFVHSLLFIVHCALLYGKAWCLTQIW